MRKLALLIGAGAAFALTMSASADLLISNWPGNDGSQTAAINDGSRTKGMGFTMPGGTGYYLTASWHVLTSPMSTCSPCSRCSATPAAPAPR